MFVFNLIEKLWFTGPKCFTGDCISQDKMEAIDDYRDDR